MDTDFTLYYSPVSSGGANYIVAKLAGLKFDAEPADFMTHKTASGSDYFKINPKGNLPSITFKNSDRIINENVSCLTFLADLNPDAKLAPKSGTMERYDYLTVLSFVASEMHPYMGKLFNPANDDATKKMLMDNLDNKIAFYLKHYVGDKKFAISDDDVCTADIYASTVLMWGSFVNYDINRVEGAKAYFDRVEQLQGVVDARAEMKKIGETSGVPV